MKEVSFLSYKTIASQSPNNKPWLLFAGDKYAVEKYLDSICEDIWNTNRKCAIWYIDADKDVSADLLKKILSETETSISQMQVVILPVTEESIYDIEGLTNSIYRLAMENRIPILPVILEDGVEEIFEEHYETMQYLVKYGYDETGLPFKEKLSRYLERILLDDDEYEEIRKAFSRRMFLSYRKMNRRYAREIMRNFHKDIRFRMISIWYDEYLTLGRYFDKEILNELTDCDFFGVVITKDLLNRDNYVVKVEYKEALQHQKMILPFIADASEYEEIDEYLPDLPAFIHADNTEELYHAIQGTGLVDLEEANLYYGQDNYRRMYLIGLAFLSGTEVEKDNGIALEMLQTAAGHGNLDACLHLSDMYLNGNGVEIDVNKALELKQEYLGLVEESFAGDPELWYQKYVEALWDLGDLAIEMGMLSEALRFYTQMEKIALLPATTPFQYSEKSMREVERNCGVAIEKRAEIEAKKDHLEIAHHLLKQCQELRKRRFEQSYSAEDGRDLVVILSKLGDVSASMGKNAQALKYYMQVLEWEEWLFKEVEEKFFLRDLMVAEHKVGNLLRMERKEEEALVHLQKSRSLAEILFQEENTEESRRDYYVSLHKVGEALLEQYQYREALEYLEKAVEILDTAKFPSRNSTLRDKAICESKISDACMELGQMLEALEHAEIFVSICRILSQNTEESDAKRVLSVALEKHADILMNQGKLMQAEDEYLQALDLRKALKKEAETPEHLLDEGVIQGKLGDYYMKRGNTSQAEVCYAAYIVNLRKLAIDGCSKEIKENLAMSLVKMAECLLSFGDVEEAELHGMEALTIFEKLIVDTDSVRIKYNITVVYGLLIRICSAKKMDAGIWFDRNLKVSKELYEYNPSIRNTCAYAVALEQIGQNAFISEQNDEAEYYFKESMKLRESLMKHTEEPDRLRELATIYNKLGLVQKSKGNAQEAYRLMLKAYDIRKILVETQGTIEDYDDIAVSMIYIGTLGEVRKDILAEAKNIMSLLHDNDPENARYISMLELLDRLIR